MRYPYIALIVLTASCQSLRPASKTVARQGLQTGVLCNDHTVWAFPRPVQALDIKKERNSEYIVFQSLTRKGSQVFLWDLSKNRSLSGQPFPLAQRGLTNVQNFSIHTDSFGRSWGAYLFRNKHVQQLNLELVDKQKRQTLRLNTPKSESVLQYWLMSSHAPHKLEVVIRSTGTEMGHSNLDSFSYYKWYQVDAKTKKSYLLGVFPDRNQSLNFPQFYYNSTAKKPYVVFVSKSGDGLKKVYSQGLFSGKTVPSSIAIVRGYIQSLVVDSNPQKNGNVGVAWVEENEDDAQELGISFNMKVPEVITGAAHLLNYQRKEMPLIIPFQWTGHQVLLEFVLDIPDPATIEEIKRHDKEAETGSLNEGDVLIF